MENVNIIKKMFLFLILILGMSSIWASENVSVELLSNKQIYQVGENVNLTLKISNLNENLLQGQIKGKVIIGDIGYEIQCFDYNAPSNETLYLGLNSLPASLSNSNKKTMSTLYACGGTQMQSTKTMVDNSPISQSGQETFELGPFTYTYNLNGNDYDIKSNVLNVTVITSQNQQQQQQQQQQSNQEKNGESQDQSQAQNPKSSNSQQSDGTQSGQNTQNSQTQNGQSLSQQGQQALANNQQNAQSVNQLKQDIANAKTNPLNPDILTKEKKSVWLWFSILIIAVLTSFLIYFKFFRKEDIKEEAIVVKKELPRYFKLLNEIKATENDKEKAKLLSQAIKIYVAEKNSLDIDLTHSKAIKLTQSKLFQEILKKTEEIEFAGKRVRLDYGKVIKDVKGEFRK